MCGCVECVRIALTPTIPASSESLLGSDVLYHGRRRKLGSETQMCPVSGLSKTYPRWGLQHFLETEKIEMPLHFVTEEPRRIHCFEDLENYSLPHL